MDRLPEELAMGSALAGRLARAIQRAYLSRIANHDPEIGDDAFTFGTGLWRSTWYFLEKEFGDQARRPHNAFFIEFDKYDLYFYGDRRHGAGHRIIGGSSVQDRILDINAQYAFDFMPTDESNGRPNLVGLHAGNSPVGLTQVHIGLPITHEDPNTAWRFLEPVYVHMETPPPSKRSSSQEPQSFRDMKAPDLDVQPEVDGDSAADGKAT